MKYIWLFIFIVGFVIRFYAIDIKPVHFDEGINGWFVERIWQNGFFRYDPTNYHGALLFYLFQMAESLFGFGIESFRYVTAGFSFATIILVYSFRDLLGKAAWMSAMFIAFSPAFVFFGRSAIHESIFVFFQMLIFMGLLNWWSGRRRLGWNLFFLGLAASVLLKETWVLSAACAMLTVILLYIFDTKFREDLRGFCLQLRKDQRIIGKDLLFWFIPFFLIVFEFGQNFSGLKRLFMAFAPWMKTGLSSGHDKSFFYWSELIVQYEFGILLSALVVFGIFCFKKNTVAIAMALFAFSLFLFYSLIPYKTPWCSISFFWPFPLLLAVILKKIEERKIYVVLAMAAVLVSLADLHASYQLNFKKYASEFHPYVYVQTTEEFGRFNSQVQQNFNQSFEFRNRPVVVLMTDTWPLPYLLQKFTALKYTLDTGEEIPSFAIVDQDQAEKLSKKWPQLAKKEIRLRFAKKPSVLFFDKEVFH